jgi:hypothetical protein
MKTTRKRSTPLAALLLTLLISAEVLFAQTSSRTERLIDNPYLTMTILRGWVIAPSTDQELNLVRGKYLLTIDPVFTHASGIEGGRFSEIAEGMPSLDAVMKNVDQPASWGDCSQSQPSVLKVTRSISLGNLYTDSSKTANGCVFPSNGRPVWFGSLDAGDAPESEYTIKLSYRTDDVNSLPKKGSAQLSQVFIEVAARLKTLHFKRPIVISGISPRSAPPGATVTVYGSGLKLAGQPAFSGLDVLSMPDPVIAPEGKSLTFQVPSSVETVSCQEGRILIGGFCLPIPPNHVNVNDCPRDTAGGTNFCGIPTPPGTYKLTLGAGAALSGDSAPFTITPPKPKPVSITIMYPVYLVMEGYTITVHGTGFTPHGNTVLVGSVALPNVSSPDGKTIIFAAPPPPANSLIPGRQVYDFSVSNSNGESNSISLEYR